MRPTRPSLRRAIGVVLISSGVGSGLAGQEVPDGEPVVLGHTYRIPSAALGEDRPVTVALPAGYDPNRAYPVIYVLDGPLHLVHTTGAVQVLSRSHRMPESIVVAVANTNRRTANMSPRVAGAPMEDPPVGRADELKAFFRDELKPWIEARYSTRPLDVLVGHSLGGTFVVHVLNTEPELFDAYLSISGNLEYDGGRFVAATDDLFQRFPNARGSIYLTMANEGGAMLASNERFVRTLEEHAPPSFRWRWRQVPGETHNSLPARATYDGLEWIFEDWNPQHLWSQLFGRGAEALPLIESHFARLSEEVGFEVEVPPERIRYVARRLQLDGRADTAVPIAQALVEWAPDHFISHWALGESLDSACRLKEARPHYREGIRRASIDGRPAYFIRALQNKLADLEERILRGRCPAGAPRPGDAI